MRGVFVHDCPMLFNIQMSKVGICNETQGDLVEAMVNRHDTIDQSGGQW